MALRWQLQRRDDREMAMSEANKTFQTLAEQKKRSLCPVPEPPPPGKDWRWWSLWIPPICSAFGFFLFGVFGYGFSQIETLPPNLISAMVITGAVLLSFGAEVGTISSIFEILRRHYNGEGTNLIDWVGLLLSMCTSIATIILSWAWLQKVDTDWSEWMKMYGPLCLGALAIGDFTVSSIEAGTYLGTYVRRRQDWEKQEYEPWLRWMAQSTGWAEMPPLEPVRPSASEEDTQEFYITRPVTRLGKPPTDLERLLTEGKTPEQIAVALRIPLPIVKSISRGEECNDND